MFVRQEKGGNALTGHHEGRQSDRASESYVVKILARINDTSRVRSLLLEMVRYG